MDRNIQLNDCYVKLYRLPSDLISNYTQSTIKFNQKITEPFICIPKLCFQSNIPPNEITTNNGDSLRKSSRKKIKAKRHDDYFYDIDIIPEKLIKQEPINENAVGLYQNLDYDFEAHVMRTNSFHRDQIKEQNIKDFEKFICDICGKGFDKKLLLRKHFETSHMSHKLNICFDCGETFQSKEFLVHHIRSSHKKFRPFICTLCPGKGKAFTRKQCLTTHIRVAHRDLIINQNNPDIEVTIIDNILTNDLLPNYTKLGTIPNEIPLKHEKINDIKQQNEKFMKLKKHLLNEDFDKIGDSKIKLKYYRCNFCGKIFNQEAHLLRHIKSVHERVKPFKCYLCPKIPPHHFAPQCEEEVLNNYASRVACPAGSKHTNSSSMLRDHYEKDPLTGYWIKSFSRKEFLVKHLRSVHQGYRAYGCELCGMRYCDKRDMDNHRKKAHCLPANDSSSVLVQTCPHPQCSHIIFTSKIHLTKHMRNFHEHSPINNNIKPIAGTFMSNTSLSHQPKTNVANGKKVPGAAAIYITTEVRDEENTTGVKEIISKDCSSILLNEANLLQINEEHARNQSTHDIVNTSNLSFSLNPSFASLHHSPFGENTNNNALLNNNFSHATSIGSANNIYDDGTRTFTSFTDDRLMLGSLAPTPEHFISDSYLHNVEEYGEHNASTTQLNLDSLENKLVFENSKLNFLGDQKISLAIVEKQENNSADHLHLNAKKEEVLSFACEGCEKLFSNRACLFRHFKSVHENHRAFICRICGRSFNQRPHLERHLSSLIHADVLKYACDYCGRRFALKSRLEKHLFDLNYHRDPNYVRVPKYVCYICTPAEALAIGDELDFVPDDSPFSALFADARRKGLLPSNNTPLQNHCVEGAEKYDDLYQDIDNEAVSRPGRKNPSSGQKNNSDEDKLLNLLTAKLINDNSFLFNNSISNIYTDSHSTKPCGKSPLQTSENSLIDDENNKTLYMTTADNIVTALLTNPNTNISNIDPSKLSLSLRSQLRHYNLDDPTKSSFIKNGELRERLLKIRQASIVRFGRKKDLIKHLKETHYGQLAFGNPNLATNTINVSLMSSGLLNSNENYNDHVDRASNYTDANQFQQLINKTSIANQGDNVTFANDDYHVNPSLQKPLQENMGKQSHFGNNMKENETAQLIIGRQGTDATTIALMGENGLNADENETQPLQGIYLDLTNLAQGLANIEGGALVLATASGENAVEGSIGGDLINFNQLTGQQIDALAAQLGVSEKHQINILTTSAQGRSCQADLTSEELLVRESHQQELIAKIQVMVSSGNIRQGEVQSQVHNNQHLKCTDQISHSHHHLGLSISTPMNIIGGNTNSFIMSNLAALNNTLGAATHKAHLDSLKNHLANNPHLQIDAPTARRTTDDPMFSLNETPYSNSTPEQSNAKSSSNISQRNAADVYKNSNFSHFEDNDAASTEPVTDPNLASVSDADLLLLPIYECKLCSRTFASRVNLRRHDERVHGECPRPTHLCEFCGQVFGFVRTLRDHISTVHEILPTSSSTYLHSADLKTRDCQTDIENHFSDNNSTVTTALSINNLIKNNLTAEDRQALDFQFESTLRSLVSKENSPGTPLLNRTDYGLAATNII